MTDASTEPTVATAGPPPSVTAHDPFPESNWLWRRAFVFGTVLLLLALVYWRVDAIALAAAAGGVEAVERLAQILRICLYLIGLQMLFYMLAPSAEQLTKMIQVSRTIRSGAIATTTNTATGADGSSATTTTQVAGAAPTPPPAPATLDPPSGEPDDAAGLPESMR